MELHAYLYLVCFEINTFYIVILCSLTPVTESKLFNRVLDS